MRRLGARRGFRRQRNTVASDKTADSFRREPCKVALSAYSISRGRIKIFFMQTPLLAITMGDPAGVGPETIAGAWPLPQVHAACRPFVVGRPEVLEAAASLCNVAVRVEPIGDPADARPSAEVMPCLPAGADDVLQTRPAVIDPRRRGGL